MKKHFRFIALVLALILAAPLVACQNKKEEASVETEPYPILTAMEHSVESIAPDIYKLFKVYNAAQKEGYEENYTQTALMSDNTNAVKETNAYFDPKTGTQTDYSYTSSERKELSATVFAGSNCISVTCPELFDGTYGTHTQNYREEFNKSVFAADGSLSLDFDGSISLESLLLSETALKSGLKSGICTLVDSILANCEKTESRKAIDGSDEEYEFISYTCENDNLRAFYKDLAVMLKEDPTVKNLYYATHGKVYFDNVFADTPEWDVGYNLTELLCDAVSSLMGKSTDEKLKESISIEGYVSAEKLKRLDVQLKTGGNEWCVTMDFTADTVEITLVHPKIGSLGTSDRNENQITISVSKDGDITAYSVELKNTEIELTLCELRHNAQSGEYSFDGKVIGNKSAGTLLISDDSIILNRTSHEPRTTKNYKAPVNFTYCLKVGAQNIAVPEFTDFVLLDEKQAINAVSRLKEGFIKVYFQKSFNFFNASKLSMTSASEAVPEKTVLFEQCFIILSRMQESLGGHVYNTSEKDGVYFDTETIKLMADSCKIKDGAYKFTDYGELIPCDYDTIPDSRNLVIIFENYTSTIKAAD
ncbi:MAG: hypothetical protein PUC29_01605 [Clostridia bacterium]|nr:hypothetical protein [Clostridia bacterium]